MLYSLTTVCLDVDFLLFSVGFVGFLNLLFFFFSLELQVVISYYIPYCSVFLSYFLSLCLSLSLLRFYIISSDLSSRSLIFSFQIKLSSSIPGIIFFIFRNSI